MGVTYTTLKIKNPITNTEQLELSAKVDTGATLLVLPEDIVKALGLTVIRKQTVKYANEETSERDIVGVVEVEVCGRKGWFEAVAEPKKKYALIGAIVIKSLDLIVEPRGLQIYPNPRSNLPMAEIE